MKNEKPAATGDRRHGTGDGDWSLILVGAVEADPESTACFRQFPCLICRVPDVREFSACGTSLKPRVVVCEQDLPDGNWKKVLHLTAPWRNSLPLIVTSRLADDRLWAEVLNLGGYDLLAKPLRHSEVNRVVGLAWDYARRAEHLRKSAGPASLQADVNACSLA